MKKPEDCININDIRDSIDKIDHEIIRLIGKRDKYVYAAAKFKKDKDAVKAPDRVKTLLKQRLIWAKENDISPEFIESLFSKLIDYFIHKETKKWEESNEIIYRMAKLNDKKSIQDLLSENGLAYKDISAHLTNFILATYNNTIVGVCGLQVYKKYGFLRSLAVKKEFRNQGISSNLLIRIFSYAQSKDIKELFLLTTTAKNYFHRYDFAQIDRDKVPKCIQDTEEFKNICPVTAICMSKKIDEEIFYYPKDALQLKEDVPGARMWAVSLNKTMLTYFEVDPNCIFDKHSHKSEQITMVLEGKLYFDLKDNIYCIEKGEVIAIPSNIPHVVFTKDTYVKAVDAWSPILKKYKKNRIVTF